MAMGSFDPRRGPGPMADINVVPLVDVMLVLLVIFIITTPLLTNAVKIALPKASSAPNVTKPDHIELGFCVFGVFFWFGVWVVLVLFVLCFVVVVFLLLFFVLFFCVVWFVV